MDRIPLKPGIAPSVQLKEQKARVNKRTVYLPHAVAKEKARRLKQLAKQAEVRDVG